MALVGGGAVLVRIDAVGKFLNALVGTASMDVARPQQVHAIISAINSLQTMTLSDAAAATEKLTTFNFWTAAEKDSMLAAVVAKAGSEASSATGSAQLRRCSQDYSAVHGYLPAKLWLMLCSDTEVTTNKLESLLMHCSNLGMRTPSEGTMQIITAIYLLTADAKSFDSMAPSVKLNAYKAVKTTFRKLLSRLRDPPLHLSVLPADPRELPPALFQLAFPKQHEGPANSTISIASLQNAIAGIPMRSSRSDSGCRATSSHQLAPDIGTVGIGSVLQQFAMGVVQQLQSVQQTQQQMLDAMMGRGGDVTPVSTPRSDGLLQLLSGDSTEQRFMRRAGTRLSLGDGSSADSLEERGGGLQLSGGRTEGGSTEEAVPATAPKLALPPPEVAKAPTEQKRVQKLSVDEAVAVMQNAMSNKTQQSKAAKAASKLDELDEKNKTKQVAKVKVEKSKQQAKQPTAKTKGATAKPGLASGKRIKTEDAAPVAKRVRPCVGNEQSRSQFMCRTGLIGIGQTHAIQYDKKKPNTIAAARAEADKWLKAELKKFDAK